MKCLQLCLFCYCWYIGLVSLQTFLYQCIILGHTRRLSSDIAMFSKRYFGQYISFVLCSYAQKPP